MTNTPKITIGHCGVDSGQLLIIDPCYLKKWKDGEFEMESKKIQNSYDEACKISLSKNQGGDHSLGGVVTSCGWGDGTYPVIATYKEGRIQKIEIKFF